MEGEEEEKERKQGNHDVCFEDEIHQKEFSFTAVRGEPKVTKGILVWGTIPLFFGQRGPFGFSVLIDGPDRDNFVPQRDLIYIIA